MRRLVILSPDDILNLTRNNAVAVKSDDDPDDTIVIISKFGYETYLKGLYLNDTVLKS